MVLYSVYCLNLVPLPWIIQPVYMSGFNHNLDVDDFQ